METTINTFCKFKEYKEKRIREFIQKYNTFLGVPWEWMLGWFMWNMHLAVAVNLGNTVVD